MSPAVFEILNHAPYDNLNLDYTCLHNLEQCNLTSILYANDIFSRKYLLETIPNENEICASNQIDEHHQPIDAQIAPTISSQSTRIDHHSNNSHGVESIIQEFVTIDEQQPTHNESRQIQPETVEFSQCSAKLHIFFRILMKHQQITVHPIKGHVNEDYNRCTNILVSNATLFLLLFRSLGLSKTSKHKNNRIQQTNIFFININTKTFILIQFLQD